jgi:hypothetical protein
VASVSLSSEESCFKLAHSPEHSRLERLKHLTDLVELFDSQ